MLIPRFVAAILSVGLVIPGTGLVSGQDYPNKSIRIVAGGAGGGGDFTARLIGSGISGPLGQSVIVDNRPAVVGAEPVSKAPLDGYPLLGQGASLWITPLLQKYPYDVARDFSAISLISREVNILAVHPSVPVKSVKELIALAKARPGELNYSSGGIGSQGHLGMELFKSMAGVNIAWILFKGSAPAITSLISGEVQVLLLDAGLLLPHAKSGRLRALAVTSTEPSALTPGLPTVAAAGLPGYEMVGVTGILAPSKTPAAIIGRLNQEIVRFIRTPETKEKFFNSGAEGVGSSVEGFASKIKSDIVNMGKLIKDAGIKPN